MAQPLEVHIQVTINPKIDEIDDQSSNEKNLVDLGYPIFRYSFVKSEDQIFADLMIVFPVRNKMVLGFINW